MGNTVSARYFLRDNFEVSEDNLRDFYDSISELGWSYQSEKYKTGYFLEDSWIDGANFSKATKKIDETGSGGLKINKGDIEGSIFFTRSEVTLNFDSTYFKDIEKWSRDGCENSKQIVELMQKICGYFDVRYMNSNSEYAIQVPDTVPSRIDRVQWANYFSNELLESQQAQAFESSSAELVEKINGGIFILSMIRPSSAGGNSRKIEKINKELGLK